jgi:hypothetical protein
MSVGEDKQSYEIGTDLTIALVPLILGFQIPVGDKQV